MKEYPIPAGALTLEDLMKLERGTKVWTLYGRAIARPPKPEEFQIFVKVGDYNELHDEFERSGTRDMPGKWMFLGYPDKNGELHTNAAHFPGTPRSPLARPDALFGSLNSCQDHNMPINGYNDNYLFDDYDELLATVKEREELNIKNAQSFLYEVEDAE